MVYSNRFVLCVLINGQPQQELANGSVSLPFETEYALRLRNKNNRRAVAKIYIDGENVSGGGYVVQANDYVDIKRHHDKDRAFKFVSLDSPEAVDHGKNGPNPDKVKGTIEVRFYLEKERPQVVYHDVHHHYHHDPFRRVQFTQDLQPADNYPMPNPHPSWPNTQWTNIYGAINSNIKAGGSSIRGSSINCAAGLDGVSRSIASTPDMECLKFNSSPPQDGCTVEGYSTGQNFYSTLVDTEDEATVLKLFLQGYVGEVAVQQRPTNKDHRIDDLEAANEKLRQKIAELENEKLRQQLEELQK